MKYKSFLCHRDAFEVNDDSGDVRKSVGIDKEGGLVFALDTMQVVVVFISRSSYVVSLPGKDIYESKASQAFPVTKIPLNNLDASLQDLHNKFWIKVHKAGDIPIMQARL